LSSSGVINSTSVGPITPPSVESANGNQSHDEHVSNSESESQANQSEPTCAIRELYNLIHNLKLQLDNVKFTEHSFVEMVNRSLSTAGINASFQLSPQKTRASLMLKSMSALPNDSILSGRGLPHPHSGSSEVSKANATYGGADTLLDNLNTSLQPTVDRSVLSVSGLNLTVAELRMCPVSPNVNTLSPKTQSALTSPRGPSLQPSRLPKARGKQSNLVGSASICEGTIQQRTAHIQPLSVSFTTGEDAERDWSRCDMVPQHSAIGDLTMVEWQNRELFERLSQAVCFLPLAFVQFGPSSSVKMNEMRT
uniref:Coiled-coil domain containing 14 n=1 Tax=Echinostoma caproni TaxID=27848 RepID=A0A183BCV5_9TREM